jgi:hypothetical protein
VDCDDINLCSRKVVNSQASPVTQEEDDQEGDQEPKYQDPSPAKKLSTLETIDQHKLCEPIVTPPYPKRIAIDKTPMQVKFNLLGELRNVCVKIPSFQAINDVPLYAKFVKELCLTKPERKKKDPQPFTLLGN